MFRNISKTNRGIILLAVFVILMVILTSFPTFFWLLRLFVPQEWIAIGLAGAIDLALALTTLWQVHTRQGGAWVRGLLAVMVWLGVFVEMLRSSSIQYRPLLLNLSIGGVSLEALLLSAFFSAYIPIIILGLSLMIGRILTKKPASPSLSSKKKSKKGGK